MKRLFGEPGGFTPNVIQFSTSFLDDTLIGVELMERVGVPANVDLRLLRACLRGEARALPLFPEVFHAVRMEARAGLLRLRENVDRPQPAGAQA